MGLSIAERTRTNNPTALLATHLLDKTLDAIEKKGRDAVGYEWIMGEIEGRLPFAQACRAAGATPKAIQEEAQRRLANSRSDDPLEQARVEDLQVLRDDPNTWRRKTEIVDSGALCESTLDQQIHDGHVESVLAPKSEDNNLPVRWIAVEGPGVEETRFSRALAR